MTEKKSFAEYNWEEGELLLLNKPFGWTSFDLVNKVKWKLKKRLGLKIKVGHAGTLDPLATGLLIICTGKWTKKIDQIQAASKVYEGTIELGATTPSFDLETEIDQRYPTEHIDAAAIRELSSKFIGKQLQVPPIYSAIKKDGKRLYELARKGKTTEIQPREIEFYSIEFDSKDFPIVDFVAHCSKGTYIRSLAHDVGTALQSGGYLKSLCRTAIGEYQLKDSMTVQEFESLFPNDINQEN